MTRPTQGPDIRKTLLSDDGKGKRIWVRLDRAALNLTEAEEERVGLTVDQIARLLLTTFGGEKADPHEH